MKHFTKFMFLTLLSIMLGNLHVWGDEVTLASWNFTSNNFPSNKTNFNATGGTCNESTFYLNGSGSTWNTSKGYAFTSVTDITITIKTTVALPAGTNITFTFGTLFYNKASNAPVTKFNLTISENNSSYVNTGLEPTSFNLNTTTPTNGHSTTYTLQNNLAVGQTIVLKLTGSGKAGSGQAYIGNISAKYTSNTIQSHNLSYIVSPEEAGSVTLNESAITENGTTTISATANDTWQFDHWTVSGTGSSVNNTSANPATFTMGTEDATVTAHFIHTIATTPEVSFANNTASVQTGNSYTNTINKPSNLDVTYSVTSGNDYATVDLSTGEVTGVAVGTATITASWEAVEYVYNAGSVSYTIDVTAAQAVTTYEKITTTSELTDGRYLIVYEEGSVAFDGSRTTLDATNNTKSVTINNNQIQTNEEIYFTINTTAGTIQSASGKYIGNASNSNGLTGNDNTLTNTLSIDEDGNAVIVSSGGAYLRYNATSGQERFRYFKSSSYTSQQSIQLYKEVGNKPTISANDISIDYDATSGTIEYTINAPVAGGSVTVDITNGDWITLGEVGNNVPFTTTANNTATPRTATVTLTYTYNTDETVTKSVTITQAANPNVVYTVTYIDGGSETEASGGAGVTLATRPDLGNYIFAGWCETNVPEETTTAPTIISTSETYHPTADITLYPIYTRTDGSSESTPSAFSVGDTGNYAIVCEKDGTYYALPTTPTVEGGKITAEEITVSENNGVKYITTANANGFTWTIAEAAYGYTLSDGSNYIYHSNGGTSGTNLAYGNNTEFTWSFTEDGDYVKMIGMSNANSNNNRGLMFNNSLDIGGYSLTNWNNNEYLKTMILPISSSTTYYWSNPTVTITFQKQNTSMYYSAYNLTVPEGVIAKTYKVENGKPVISKTYQAGETIAKATAVILTLPVQPSNAANLGLAKDFRLASTGVADEDNKLVGWDEATQVSTYYPAEEYIAYVLSTKNGDNPGFYFMNGHPEGDTKFQSGAHKAVFPVLKSEASSSKSAWLFSEIDDEVTGISDASIMNNEERAEHNGVYDLQGRKVADNLSSILSHPSSQKGIYIVNGKKVIIK